MSLLLSVVPASSEEAKLWVVERDMPGSRNLVPILNRATVLAVDSGEVTTCTVLQPLSDARLSPGPFWPVFGDRARMSVPLSTPEGFPPAQPKVLGDPVADRQDGMPCYVWRDVEVAPGRGAVVFSDTLLGPPDMFHSDTGLRFGDLVVETRYSAEGHADGSVSLVCCVTLTNSADTVLTDLEYALFLPDALLDLQTGGATALLTSTRISAEGLSDADPLKLLVCDGFARGAWGYRCVVRRKQLDTGQAVAFRVVLSGIVAREALLVPIVTVQYRTASRFWASSRVMLGNSRPIEYSDYTQFNLVVADSRMFRLTPAAVSVERSSAEVRARLTP